MPQMHLIASAQSLFNFQPLTFLSLWSSYCALPCARMSSEVAEALELAPFDHSL